MGKHREAEVEMIRSLMALGAAALQVPEVANASQALRAAIQEYFPDTAAEVAALTILAGTSGISSAVEGLEHEAQEVQLTILRSLFATHQFANRTLH